MAQTSDTRRLADLEAQIFAMQEQIRQLKGQAEDAAYQARQANQRVEQLLSDVDARFQALEPNSAGAAATSPSADDGSRAAVSPPAGSVAPPASSGAGGSLGTLSNDTLLSLPEPPPEPPAPDATADTGSSRDRFDAGMAQVKAGDWAGAEAAFASVVARGPDDPIAPNAAYWQGETYYARKEWAQAAATFARNIRTYGADAVRSSDNVLKLGMSLSRLGDTQKACAAFGEFDRRYANAPAALKQMAGREKANASCS